jgi:periplasmic copper chaperone A
MFNLTKLRIVEIGVAVLLTLAAILFVGLTVWAAEDGAIDIADAWARPTIGESRMTAAYMTIANKSGDDDVLKAAHSPKAESVELHQTTMTADGVMKMRKVEGGLPIEAGASVELGPGGTHLMVVGLKDALEAGEKLMLTLEFAKAGFVDVLVPVSATAPQSSTDAKPAQD